MLKAVTVNPQHTMALKVTALTHLSNLRELNVGLKKLYDMFVDIAGYELDAFVTKKQVNPPCFIAPALRLKIMLRPNSTLTPPTRKSTSSSVLARPRARTRTRTV